MTHNHAATARSDFGSGRYRVPRHEDGDASRLPTGWGQLPMFIYGPDLMHGLLDVKNFKHGDGRDHDPGLFARKLREVEERQTIGGRANIPDGVWHDRWNRRWRDARGRFVRAPFPDRYVDYLRRFGIPKPVNITPPGHTGFGVKSLPRVSNGHHRVAAGADLGLWVPVAWQWGWGEGSIENSDEGEELHYNEAHEADVRLVRELRHRRMGGDMHREAR